MPTREYEARQRTIEEARRALTGNASEPLSGALREELRPRATIQIKNREGVVTGSVPVYS